MNTLSEKDLLTLIILADEKGHSITELASKLSNHKGSVKHLLEKLIKKEIIYNNYPIENKSQPSFSAEDKTTYYLRKDLDVFCTIVTQLLIFQNRDDTTEKRTSYKFTMNELADGGSHCDIFGFEKRAHSLNHDKIEELISLELKLEYCNDPLSQYIRDHFSDKTRSDLERYRGKAKNPKNRDTIRRDLVDELNNLLDDENLYSPERFKHLLPLPFEARELLEQKPKGLDLNRLNRILLNEAYTLDLLDLKVSPFSLDNFLYSKYTDNMIKECSLWMMVEALKPYVKVTDLLAFVTRAVRNGLATTEERNEIVHALVDEGLIIIS